jgi:hypothetical protein
MDRRRRLAPVITPARSWAAGRSCSAALVFAVAVVVSFSGCRDRKEEARQRSDLTNALDQFKAAVAELQKQSSALRIRFDKLPDDLPGLDGVRDDLHTLEEVVGVEDGRTKWLSLELSKAFASGDKAELEKLRTAIPRSTVGISQVVVKVMHELLPLERLAEQRRFFEAVDAANAHRR